MNQQQGVGGASWTPEGAKAFSPAEVKRMQIAMNAYKSMGTPEGDEKAQGIANMLDRDEFAKSMDEFGGKEPGRIGKAINKVLKRPEGSPGMGSADIGNMFTELTLGWTAFRMRMAWNLTTGAQKGWQDAFMNEEAAAAGAALAGGAPAGLVGNSSQYLAANAAIANSKAQLGQGVAQVYAPFMSGVAGVDAGAGLGAAATIGGTAVGRFIPFCNGRLYAFGRGRFGRSCCLCRSRWDWRWISDCRCSWCFLRNWRRSGLGKTGRRLLLAKLAQGFRVGCGSCFS